MPLDTLSVHAEVVRPGRRVMLLEASIHDPAGTEVVRARALRVRPSEVGEPAAEAAPFPGPDRDGRTTSANAGSPMFATDAMEIRFVEGTFREPGRAIAWFRLRQPLVSGETAARLSCWRPRATSATASPRSCRGRRTCSSIPI